MAEYRGSILLGLLIGGLICGTIGNYYDSYSKLNLQTKIDNQDKDSDGVSPYWSDKFYLSWTQFFADGSVTPRDSFLTRIGRMLGLAFVSLLAYEAYTKLFANEILDAIIKRQKNHTLICGSGRIGRALAKDLLSDQLANHSVTVIEQNPNSIGLDELRELGANVLIADATLRRNLKRAGCDRAKEIFVVTGSDEANLDIAADVIELLGKDQNLKEVPSLHVHLHQMRLESVLMKSAKIDSRAGIQEKWKENLKAFNPLSESIRSLFDDYVLVRRPKNEDEIAHYVIVGFGNTGQNLALYLAENAHFVNFKRARMTIVHRQEEMQAVNRFNKLYPKFFPSGQNELTNAWEPQDPLDAWGYDVVVRERDVNEEYKYIDSDGKQVIENRMVKKIVERKSKGVPFVVNGGFLQMEGGVTSPEFTENLYALCKAEHVRPIVFICHGDDEENCAEAIELRELMDQRLKITQEDGTLGYGNPNDEISIFAYVPDHPSLFDLINQQNPSDRPDMIAWGDCQSSCTYEHLKSKMIDQLAKAIYTNFCEYENKKKKARKEQIDTYPEFLDAATWEILSNRKAALHVNTKLAVVGAQVVYEEEEIDSQLTLENLVYRHQPQASRESDGVETGDKSTLERFKELIARIEQNRYVAERLLQDWSLGNETTPENRKRSGIVDWDHLRDKDSERVCSQINAVIEFVNKKTAQDKQDRLALVPRRGESNEQKKR
ncbi:MAG: potassium channel family protein [Planctomycetota bacterium]